jgi:RHS repeat-associated protein
MGVAVNAFNQSSVIRRVLTPYGQTASGSQSWIDQRAFLGDSTQQATGLTNIGARVYDAVLGAFISVDSNLNTDQPQSMTGYEYSGDNPVDNSDPSGAMFMADGGGGGGFSFGSVFSTIWSVVTTLMSFVEANPVITASNALNTAAGVGLSAAPITSNFNEFRQALAAKRTAQIKLANPRSPKGAQVLNARRAAAAEEDAGDALDAGKGMKWAGRGLAVAGGIIGGWNEYESDTGDSVQGKVGKAVVAGAWDTGTSVGIGLLGDMATAAIVGSSLGPVGTIAAVGGVLVVSAIASIAASNVASHVANAVVGGVRGAVHGIENSISDLTHAFTNPFSW